ncbi:MAG: diguanylate cyclase [Candidatus Omnitrophota bacterium]|nr:diguanylate cyclase [Candidatus Omnitrophota bacterium]
MGQKNGPGFSVLVVEEDNEFLSLLKRSLEDNPRFPYRVDQARNISEAVDKIGRNSYNLLLVESTLQDHNGLELLDQLNRSHINLPFVLMTDVRDDRLAREALKLGVADTIIKSESQFHELAELLAKSYQKYCDRHPEGNLPQMRPAGRRSGDRDAFEFIVPEAAERKIAEPSHRDELTGLYSHSFLQERIVQQFSSAARYNYPMSCIVLNIDHFKAINEGKGYLVGDKLLKECAELLFDKCRMCDVIARYGGEEFAVMMPHVSYAGAMELAKRLRTAFSEHIFMQDSEQINLTVSVGVSSYPEDSMSRRCELMSFSNQALFRSKVAGRNTVTAYKDILPVFGSGLPNLHISEDKVAEFQRRLTEISHTARRAYIDASKALIIALESKDRFTAGHAASSAKYAIQVAEALGMSIDEAEVVEHAALLHDIGKICIPDNILLKPGKLTFSEYEAMKQHPYMGYKILKPIKFLQEESILVLHHHEWFNGEGYPCRLKGNEIPLGARVISVIDAYDTMRIAGGRYRATATVEVAVNDLIACSGTQFDPVVVKAFIEVVKMRRELTTEDYNKDALEEAIRNCLGQ